MDFDPSTLPHDSRGPSVIIAGAVTTALALIAVCARLYTRHFIVNQVGIDDYMAIGSILGMIGMNVSQSINASHYLGRHFYDLNVPVDLPRFLELFWINEIFYNIAMFFIKMTFLFQYYRVFRHIQKMRIAYVVSIVLIGGWCLGQLLAVIFTCVPVSGFWDKTIESKCQDQLVGVYLNAIGTLVTDILILVLPLPALWKLKLPKSQKWALLGIFGLGSFTSAISIVRITTLGGEGDFTYDAGDSACWSVAELASGIIAAALATIRPLVSRYVPALASRASKSTNGYQRYGDVTIGSVKTGTTRRSSYVKKVPKDITTGSETDLFYGGRFELQEHPSKRRDIEAQMSISRVSSDTAKSDSFNTGVEEDLSPRRPARSMSVTFTRSPHRDQPPTEAPTEDGEMWSGVQTKVTGGAPRRPQSSHQGAGRQGGLAIRVDRDWVVQESPAPI